MISAEELVQLNNFPRTLGQQLITSHNEARRRLSLKELKARLMINQYLFMKKNLRQKKTANPS